MPVILSRVKKVRNKKIFKYSRKDSDSIIFAMLNKGFTHDQNYYFLTE
jgi:hypothetical protein